jgi:hypothetical protein
MLAMNLLEKIYNNLNHEKIWGSDGLPPLNNFKSNSGGYTACCPNPEHPEKKPSFLMKEGIPAGKCQSCRYHLTWFDAAAMNLTPFGRTWLKALFYAVKNENSYTFKIKKGESKWL